MQDLALPFYTGYVRSQGVSEMSKKPDREVYNGCDELRYGLAIGSVLAAVLFIMLSFLTLY